MLQLEHREARLLMGQCGPVMRRRNAYTQHWICDESASLLALRPPCALRSDESLEPQQLAAQFRQAARRRAGARQSAQWPCDSPEGSHNPLHGFDPAALLRLIFMGSVSQICAGVRWRCRAPLCQRFFTSRIKLFRADFVKRTAQPWQATIINCLLCGASHCCKVQGSDLIASVTDWRLGIIILLGAVADQLISDFADTVQNGKAGVGFITDSVLALLVVCACIGWLVC
mmetsp:Transcript_33791/g.75550  ORF Transcript_33791/g.75550 Transcript_33791/m.75550 type:complete len:229 (+) Transcript_33791:1485-2171(+)